MPIAGTSTAQGCALATEQNDKVLLAASRACLENGYVNRAAQIIDKLSYQRAQPPHSPMQFAAKSTLGEVYQKQGKLHLAAATYQSLLDWVDLQPGQQELLRFYWGLCSLYYEWNQLEKAGQYLQGCVEMLAQSTLPPIWASDGYIRLAWIRWAEGNGSAAHAALHQASVIAQRADQPPVARQVAAHWARLWLRQGELEPALRWANEAGLSIADNVRYPRQFEALTLVRTELAQGHAAPVLPLLCQLQRAATTDGRAADLIEILGLKAIAFWTQGDAQRAWTELAQALCRAEREEYIRTFVDEGLPMAELLQQTAAKGITLIYVKKLLTTCANSSGTRASPTPLTHDPTQGGVTLVEPLTRRECELLHLVATGNANIEIAHFLSISLTTVKKHLSNIFGKLGAKNRTEAVAKARALHLLTADILTGQNFGAGCKRAENP